MGAPLLGGGDDCAREERRRAKEEAEGRALDALGALLRPHVTQGSRERAKDVAHTALAGAGFGAVIGAAWGGFREVRGIRHELQVNERVRAAAAVAAARSGHTAGHVKQQPLSEGLFTGYKMQSLSFMLSRAVRGAAVYGGASLAYAGLFDALRFGGGLDALGVDTSAARGESGDSKPHALAAGATAAVIVGLANASLAAPSIAMRAGRATIGLTVGGVAGWAAGRLQAELFRWAKEKQMLEALREEAAVAGKAL